MSVNSHNNSMVPKNPILGIKIFLPGSNPKALPRPPTCIQSNKYGNDGCTTCINETLLEIKDFLQQFYKTSEALPPLISSRLLLSNPCSRTLKKIAQRLKHTIHKQNPDKAHGLDGITVAQFKKIDDKGLSSLAVLFLKCMQLGETPHSWLDSRVACIPKKTGFLRVQNLRPLCIAPVDLRLFLKRS